MGFIRETYTNGHAGLIVNFSQTENDSRFCASDSVEEAMKYFNLYLDSSNNIRVNSESDQAMNTLEIKPEEAKDFRKKVDSILPTLTDEQAIDNVILFPTWSTGVNYRVNDRVRYNDKLYKVLQAHTSQVDWTPDAAASLFAPVLIEDPNAISPWKQPDSTNGYMTGDKVLYNEIVYVSQVDNNVWAPGTNETLWKPEVAETPVGEETTVSEFVSGTSYMLGDQIMFNDKKYESLIDNNVWSPTDYPAGWEEVV